MASDGLILLGALPSIYRIDIELFTLTHNK